MKSISFLGLVATLCCFLSLGLVQIVLAQDDEGVYKIGVGIGDITGPPAGIVLNGYVNPLTYAAGIYTRQYARSFLVESVTSKDSVVYVTCDLGMMDHSIKVEVIKKLSVRYGDKYTMKNVMLSSTHTHSGVSGFMTYYAYLIIESYGFNPLSYWSIVDGVVESIEKATDSAVLGQLYWNKGDIIGGNGNRQTNAYMANPEDERSRYADTVDTEMVILKLETLTKEPLGVFTWWAVHPITFNDWDNPLVSSDNKGYAAILFDQKMNPPGTRPGNGKFVSGFGSSNLGDVSPRTENMARINVTDQIARTRELGTKQFEKALELFEDENTLTRIKGPVRFAHQFVDTDTVQVDVMNSNTGAMETLKLCKPALGYSYVGLNPDEQIWELIRDLIKKPSPEMIACQAPKVVALAAGEMDIPWQWAPSIFSLQLLQVGDFDIIGTPGEYTTMSGRRVRNAVFNVTNHQGVIAGLCNNYINYIATPEEYDVQEYEGGATIYGRNTVPITAALFAQMATALENGEEITEGPEPPSFLDKVRDEIQTRIDIPFQGLPFGTVITNPNDSYKIGDEVTVIFSGASPRHSPIRGGTFLLVEKLNEDGLTWTHVRTDADLDTTFWWNSLLNRAEIKWRIGQDVTPGSYRIRHFGYHLRKTTESPRPYSGTSSTFQVTATVQN